MNPLNHVAIIMDGNGRWGMKHRNSRNEGHKEGLKTVEKIIKETIKNKINFLTLFAFSTENWKRPKKEINYLFKLLENFLIQKINNLHSIEFQEVENVCSDELVDIVKKQRPTRRKLKLIGFTDQAVEQLAKVSQYNNLQYLDLSCNGMSANVAAHIGCIMRRHPQLEELVLMDNNLGDKGIECMFQFCSEHPKLRKLNL